MRKLHIDNKQWSYTIGDRFAVIKSPTNKRVNVELTKIKNIPQEKIDAGRGVPLCDVCSGTCWVDQENGLLEKVQDGMVTPSEIKDYIVNNPTLWE